MDEDEDIGGLGSAVTGEGINALMTPGLSSADARAAFSKAQGAVEKQISANLGLLNAAQDRLRAKRVGPSDAEKYFAIAAALGQPTRTGSFGETVGNLGTLLGKYSGAKREAESERESLLEKLGMQTGTEQLRLLTSNAAGAGQLMRAAATAEAAAAKASQPIFRGTAEMGGKVVMLYEDPRTGKVTPTPVGPAKQDLIPTELLSGGQPVFRMGNKTVLADGTPVTQFDKPERKLSPGELRMVTQDEDALTGATTAIGNLRAAIELSPKAYEGGFTTARQLLGSMLSSDSPEYVNSELLDNLLKKNALSQLKATFPGAISNAETQILTKLQGAANQPRAVREGIMREALVALQQIEQRVSKHRDAVLAGTYGVVRNPAAPSTPSKPGKPRIVNWKN
jgi:hypothetical protein